MAHNDELASRFFDNGEQITASITVQKPASDIYSAWAGLSGLAQFVEGLQSVGAGADRTLEFKARDPSDPASVLGWNAEILKDEPGRIIAWRSVGEPAIPNAGSVTLHELPFNRGTEVKVAIDFIPPKGALLQRLDKALGRDPRTFLRLTLFRFRQLMEAGELATTRGQPAGRDEGRDAQGSGDEQKYAKAEDQT